MLGFILLLSSANFFHSFSKNSFRHTIKLSNSLDPDQDCGSVRSALGPNCLQRLSACGNRVYARIYFSFATIFANQIFFVPFP